MRIAKLLAALTLAVQPMTSMAAPQNGDNASRSPASQQAANAPYSLAQLLELALTQHAAVRLADNETRQADLGVDVASSAFQPRVNLAAGGMVQSADKRLGTGGVELEGNSQTHGVLTSLSLEWLLFDFGGRTARLDVARHGSRLAGLARSGVQQQIAHEVTLAFYRHAAAVAHVTAAQKSFANAQAIEQAAIQRRKNGIGTVIEVAQASHATAQATLALTQANGAREDAYLAVLSAAGLPPDTRIELADVSPRTLTDQAMPAVDALIADAMAQRPDVQGADVAFVAAQSGIKAVQSEFKPRVFATASLTQASGGISATATPAAGLPAAGGDISGARHNSSLFIGVTMPLYDAGVRRSALSKALIDADNAAIRSQHVREEAKRQVMNARNGLATSLAAYRSADALQLAARTTFDAALAAYQSGVGAITEVLLADTQLQQAQRVYSDGYFAVLSAGATLARATGDMQALSQPASK
ncbi:TolC family protein [Burkholderiaceae bacterium DAT-1]|nr:TolC family protein [Burkholderiaceae bacterium DAT-1]